LISLVETNPNFYSQAGITDSLQLNYGISSSGLEIIEFDVDR